MADPCNDDVGRGLRARARSTTLIGGLALLPFACTQVKEHFPELPPETMSGGTSGGSGNGGGNGSSSGGAGGRASGGGGSNGGSNPSPSGTGGQSGGSGGGASGNGGSPGSGSGGQSGPTDGGPVGSGGSNASATGGTGGSNPPPPAGSTIDIGGKAVPTDKVVAFIYIGTSNLAGRAQEPNDLKNYFLWYGKSLPGGLPDPKLDPSPLPTDPRLWMFNLEEKFVPAREPSASDQSTDQGAGPGMAIMRAAAAKWPDHTFISIGRGQSGERGGYCAHFLERNLITNQPWSTTPPTSNSDTEGNKAYGFYNEVINRRALKLKGKVTFGGIITMFGATEERPGAPVPSPPAEPYLSQCLIKIASTYREALGDPNIPFIIGDFEHGMGDYTYEGVLGQKVRRQVQLAKNAVSNSDVITTDGIEMRDDHHFTMRGHKTWGDRAIEIIDKRGWATWAKK
ncbi:MAG TPA: sialate O-acetylesterase [Polyangia bacterium]